MVAETERNPGICAGCSKDVEYRGQHEDGHFYCTNCLELGNFIEDESSLPDEYDESEEETADNSEDPEEDDAEYFSNSPEAEEEEQGESPEEEADQRPVCPYCDEPQDPKGIGPHKRFCDENPENQEDASAEDPGETDENDEPDSERSTSDDQSEDPDEEPHQGQSENGAETQEGGSSPPERIQVGGTDAESDQSETQENNYLMGTDNGGNMAVDHYTVSVLRVETPEFGEDLFVAYTENSSHSDNSPEKAVAGLVGGRE